MRSILPPSTFPAVLAVVSAACSSGSADQPIPSPLPGVIAPGAPGVLPGQPGVPVVGQPGVPVVGQPGVPVVGQPAVPGTPVGTPQVPVTPPTPGAPAIPGVPAVPGAPGIDVQAICAAQQEVAPTPLRRLSHREYQNTLRDLMGLEDAYEVALPPDRLEHGFDNSASQLNVGQLLSDTYVDNAAALASEAIADLPALLPCAATGSDACATEFIADFGKRAFRRPLSAEESADLFGLFEVGKDASFEDGIRLVMTAVLSSSSFLYRLEVGSGVAAAPGTSTLTPYEIATRLAYTFTGSMPDAELTQAADAGLLSTPDQIMAQAERLMNTPAAHRQMVDFYAQWFSLREVEEANKDDDLFTPAVRDSMAEETRRFVEHVFFEDDARMETLLTARYSFINDELAAIYGVDAPAGGDFARTDMPAPERVGFLTHASLLAGLAQPNQSDPVLRGEFVREQLLCQTLPDPPNDIVIQPPEVEEGVTTRERFIQHQEDPACAGCHVLLDDIGFAFENFDELGRWRDTDQGQAIDASGRFVATLDLDGDFNGVTELAEKLSQSAEVRACAARQWFRFTRGRDVTAGDACTMAQLESSFANANGDFRQLVLTLTQTSDFLTKRVVQ